jgi:hypothetical protein
LQNTISWVRHCSQGRTLLLDAHGLPRNGGASQSATTAREAQAPIMSLVAGAGGHSLQTPVVKCEDAG